MKNECYIALLFMHDLARNTLVKAAWKLIRLPFWSSFSFTFFPIHHHYLRCHLEHRPARQLACSHQRNELVQVIQSSSSEDGMNKIAGAEVKRFFDILQVTGQHFGYVLSSASISRTFRVPVTLPTMFNRFNARTSGGAPPRISVSTGSPTHTTVPPGRARFGATA